MYAEFFGLRELPFNNTPDPRFFYSTPDHEEALASLMYAVRERKGFVLLTGEVGAGKTLVSRLMLKHFAGTVAFANINHAIRGPGDLMESLCAEFEIEHEKNAGNTHLVRLLHDFLLAKFAQNVGVVLVLDEAQNLSVEAFEQLRMIGNLEADDAKLLQIAIVGQPELQTTFQSAALRQLRQRLFRSFHLPALDRSTVEGYIRHRLTVAGAADPGIFASRAIELIHKASRGLPRLINTICDNAMLSAYSADRKSIDGPFVESVLGTIMIGETSMAQSVPETPPPPPVRLARREVPSQISPEQRQQCERLEEVCSKAANWVRQLDASSRRAAQMHHDVARHETQLNALLKGVKSSAAQLAPMLDELNAAVRGGAMCNENAQATLRRLMDQTAHGEVLLDRLSHAVRQARVEGLQARPAAVRVHSDPVPLRNIQQENEQPRPEISTGAPSMLRQADVPRGKVIPELAAEPFTDHGRPALRLARRMEDLADLVHQAVAACTPASATT